MSALYVETSAVLAWLLGQRGAGEVRRTVDAAETIVTSALTFAETEHVLVRAEVEGIVRGGDAQRLRGLLHRTGAGWMRMAVTAEVLDRASRPFPAEPLRTLDAIHLATALSFAQVFPDLEVLSLDRRVAENARALGIS